MAEAKFDIGQWQREVNELLTGLKKETKNKEFINKISDVQSVLKNAENVNQIISQSPFAQANIIDSNIIIGTPSTSIDISSAFNELIELLQVLLKKKTRTSVGKISNKTIETIINKTTENIADLINEKYKNLCEEVKSKIEAVLEAISKIETRDKEISEKLKSILSKTNSILRFLKDNIAKQLGTMQKLLGTIDTKITTGTTEIKSEISSLSGEVNNLNRSLTDSQMRIEATLKEHSEKLDLIINALTEIKAKIAALEELLKDLKPESLKKLFDLINDLTNTVNEVKGSVKGIGSSIADTVFPTIERICQGVDKLAVEFPKLAGNVNTILIQLGELSKTTGELVTKKDLEEWMQDIIEEIRNSTKNTGPIRGHDEPDANKRFELIWIVVKNEKVANEMKKEEVFPKPKEYVLLNQNHITANLNEPVKKELFANEFLTRKASEIASKGFDIDKIYVCLGARVEGTEKPVRWDIKHLKTSAPDIYDKLKSTLGNKKSDAEAIAEIENSLKKWKSHKFLKKGPNTTLQYCEKDMIPNIQNILNKLETLFKTHNDKFGTIRVFQEVINTLMISIEAWETTTPARILGVHATDTHIGLIDKISLLVERYIKPALIR